VSFFVEGDYFEVCNCDVSCNCIWLGAATRDNCDVLLAWHVDSGNKDGVDLSGLNAVMAVHTPKRMTDGGWKVALYLDDRASAEQSEALGAVFSGGAGGHLAGLAPLIGEVAGVAPASITFEKTGGSLHAEVAGALSMSSDQLVGMDGQEPGVIGSVLMELMACYLVAHKVPKDPAREADIRAKLLAAWCETVWARVASYEGKGERLQ